MYLRFMKSLYDYITETMVNEKLITFNNRAYPKNNQIVIMAGGAGSGKGFVVSNVLGIDAKVLNVDDIKEQLVKMDRGSELSKRYHDTYGKWLDEVDMTDAEDTSNIHAFAKDNALANKMNDTLFKQQADKKDKINVLFDVTLKDYPKIEDISRLAALGGYDPKDIHLVWVLNNYDTAVKQNAMRARRVSDKILKGTHGGCAQQMLDIMKYSAANDLVNGDIWIYFGSTFTGDTKQMTSPNGGKYLEDFCAVKCKEAGKPMVDYNAVMDMPVKVYDADGKETGEVTLREKINTYIPLDNEKF